MPSPFPGMDPYLEGPLWPDFHAILITSWRVALNSLLPPNYRAQIDERISLITSDPAERKLVRPDVAVEHEKDPWRIGRQSSAGATAVAEPIIRHLPMVEELRETRIEILKRPQSTVVAIIEILYPWNKAAGAGCAEYAAKRIQILRQPVHLIEVDLLLAGRRLEMSEPLPPGDYYTLVAHGERRPDCEVYAWTLRDPFPVISLPLQAPDPDIPVDLGAIFQAAYAMGDYLNGLRYDAPVQVPLAPAERNWVQEVAKTAARA